MENIEDIYELSHMQQGMLFHTLYAPESGIYFEQMSCTLRGSLNVKAFKSAWQQVAERHPVFRTSFLWEDLEKPLQVVHRQVEVPWIQQDWRGLAPDKRQQKLENFLLEDRKQGFELDQAPLMRCALIRETDNTYHFVWSHHHLLMDGWCLPIVLKEVFAFYENQKLARVSEPSYGFRETSSPFVKGGQGGFTLPRPRPYREYIIWLQQQDLSEAEVFWRQTLQGFTAPTPLVVDKIADNFPDQNVIPKTERLRLPVALTTTLQTFAQQHRITLNTLVQGTWAILLSRYSGETDIVFGTTVSGRPADLSGAEAMVGLFINTLPVRVQVIPEDSPVPWLQVLQSRQTEIRQYEYSPLVQIQGWSSVPRGILLFESIVVFENYPMDVSLRELSSNLEITDVHTFERTNYPLTVAAFPSKELLLEISYDVSRFDAATIQRMLGHLCTLMEGITTNNGQRISELPLLTEAERHQILVEWNDTETDYPKDKCIHALFEEQVGKTPDAIAVVFEEEELTYWELNARANRLAHYLRALGVGPEVLVGICVERSLEMVVGLLGILKAGGAYVPLDPDYPKERLAFMLEDSRVPFLLTQRDLVSKLPEHRASVICLDTDWGTISQESEKNLLNGATSENVAYVIYTSGSTGTPKGTLITHRGLCNVSEAQVRTFALTSHDKVLQFSSLSFDAATFEIVMALRVGAGLCLGKREHLLPGSGFIRLLRDQAVTIVTLPPSALTNLSSGEFPALRIMTVAGEACSADLVARWAEECLFFNLYGPTETTIWATVAQCMSSHRQPPIGRPIANTQIYILDDHLQPVPVGIPGELYIGGVGLARGYLNRFELTAEKFIPNPFSDDPGARLYKTGDLVRYLSDGNIEFLGRMDHQVKIRGFRIELGEIEAVLSQHPTVQETVALVRENQAGDKRLVAYVVPNSEQVATISELRHFLKEKLPDYMVPSAFVFLEAFPLTPNGKVDRKALPMPDQTRPELEETFVAPRTPVEEILAGIWANVLDLKQVGVHDNFFELGGHSLLAMQLVSRISTAINLHISVSLLFLYSTIAELAVALEELLQNRELGVTPETQTMDNAEQIIPIEDVLRQQSPAFFQLERRPLLSLFADGEIAPVDAAALGYFPGALLKHINLSRDEFIHDWCDDLPVWSSIMETRWGRIAGVILPLFSSELYRDSEELVQVIVKALEFVGRVGARIVSLTGLIPSATDYGRDIAKAIVGRSDLPLISTGHATTSAAVVLSIKRILQEGGRDLSRERVGFIGLGSVGLSTLHLMLKCLPHPMEITLCDVYSKIDFLHEIRQKLQTDSGFRGNVRVIESQAEVPREIYDATLIIGATNVPDILDITKVKSGTMIVDDSAPHCFTPELAARRFQEQQDILFTEGGVLQSPEPIKDLTYLPQDIEKILHPSQIMKLILKSHPSDITGCVFSSLLSACFEELKPTIGFVNGDTSFQHYEILENLGFQAADLHCRDYGLSKEFIRNFRYRFGRL